MKTENEYIRRAEEAQEEHAHVAVFTHYRTALELAGYSADSAQVLLAAVQYAQGLKKERDREAIREWGEDAVGKMPAETDLVETINAEIEKLKAGGEQDATTA
ncbi:MAG: hypothetical protein ABIE94_06625 [archaeon]